MANPFDTFILSLNDAGEPAFATPMLRAVWHGLRGNWDTAHDLAQAQDDSQGAWVHAWLHRIEGDLANAGYWYRRAGLQPRSEWRFRTESRNAAVPVEGALTVNQADVAVDACASGLGLGFFLSYMVAPLKRSGKLRYVLENFEAEPLPVHVAYPHSRLLSANVRAFVDLCVQRLRKSRFD